MPVLGIQGLRGGVGATSLTAALGWALQTLEQSVIIVDACADNMLRLFFNDATDSANGWARALIDQQPWQDAGMRYCSRLDFLPFGQLTAAERLDLPSLAPVCGRLNALVEALHQQGGYQWILLDLPHQNAPWMAPLIDACDEHLTVAVPDANCHIRLHQQPLPTRGRLLVNTLQTASQLQEDIYQLWVKSQPRLLPVVVHRDEAMAECLAAKQPLGEYRPDALSTEEVLILANWYLLRAAGAAETEHQP